MHKISFLKVAPVSMVSIIFFHDHGPFLTKNRAVFVEFEYPFKQLIETLELKTHIKALNVFRSSLLHVF